MKVSKNKAILILFAVFIGLAMISTSLVGHVKAEEPRPLPLFIRGRGIAINTNTLDIMRLGQVIVCVPLEPGTDNPNIIPLQVVGGVIRIGLISYNVTGGSGAIDLRRHVLTLFCNGTHPRGPKFGYRLTGAFTRTPEGLQLTRFIGVLNIVDHIGFETSSFNRPSFRPLRTS
jgi:hypothetical protein